MRASSRGDDGLSQDGEWLHNMGQGIRMPPRQPTMYNNAHSNMEVGNYNMYSLSLNLSINKIV